MKPISWKKYQFLYETREAFDNRSQAPFPGRYPTRMWISVKIHNRWVVRYFGKPSQTQLRRAIKILAKSPTTAGTIHIGEVDKNGFIGLTQLFGRGAQVDLPLSQLTWNSQLNTRLRYAYHPFDKVATRCFGWLEVRQFVKRATNGSIRYSPNKLDKIPAIKTYKETLVAYGIQVAS